MADTQAVPKVGYYLPFAAAGSAIGAVGNGLVSTFSPNTPTHRWVGYQIILGSGRGIGMQMVSGFGSLKSNANVVL